MSDEVRWLLNCCHFDFLPYFKSWGSNRCWIKMNSPLFFFYYWITRNCIFWKRYKSFVRVKIIPPIFIPISWKMGCLGFSSKVIIKPIAWKMGCLSFSNKFSITDFIGNYSRVIIIAVLGMFMPFFTIASINSVLGGWKVVWPFSSGLL